MAFIIAKTLPSYDKSSTISLTVFCVFTGKYSVVISRMHATVQSSLTFNLRTLVHQNTKIIHNCTYISITHTWFQVLLKTNGNGRDNGSTITHHFCGSCERRFNACRMLICTRRRILLYIYWSINSIVYSVFI